MGQEDLQAEVPFFVTPRVHLLTWFITEAVDFEDLLEITFARLGMGYFSFSVQATGERFEVSGLMAGNKNS